MKYKISKNTRREVETKGLYIYMQDGSKERVGKDGGFIFANSKHKASLLHEQPSTAAWFSVAFSLHYQPF